MHERPLLGQFRRRTTPGNVRPKAVAEVEGVASFFGKSAGRQPIAIPTRPTPFASCTWTNRPSRAAARLIVSTTSRMGSGSGNPRCEIRSGICFARGQQVVVRLEALREALRRLGEVDEHLPAFGDDAADATTGRRSRHRAGIRPRDHGQEDDVRPGRRSIGEVHAHVDSVPVGNARMGADFVTNACRSLHTRTRGPRAAPAAATCAAVVLLAVVATAATGCGGADADPATIARAKQAFAAAKADGVDMSRGPCLGVIEPGWVADVAHDPREDVDDEPANQCAAYRSGEAEHFVELDPAGNVIRSG